MGKILVPVDLSECSENNCLLGLNMAQMIKADIHLLHCYNDIKLPSLLKSREEFMDLDLEFVMSEEEVKKRMDLIVDGLETKIKSLNISNISVECEIVKSYPSQEIVKQCSEISPDLLLLSTKSVGDRVKKLIGSLTYHIITSVDVPVLSIPENSNLDLKNKINLCFICDFKECEINSLKQLLKLICRFNVNITLLHIGDIKDDEVKFKKLTEFDRLIKGLPNKQEIAVEFIETSDKVEGISEFARIKEIDILSLTTIRKSFFKKIFYPDLAKNLFFELDKPLLVFHS